MRLTLLSIIPFAAVMALLAAPVASADPSLPQCVNTEGSNAEGGSNTECATPGNVQIDSSPGQFNGPWGDMWNEDGLFFP